MKTVRSQYREFMAESDRKRLKKQIERLCEKQYRKGVQQGAEFVQQYDLGDRMKWIKSISKWRHYGSNNGYKQAKTFDKGIYMPDGFLRGECAMGGMEELLQVLR